MTIKVYNNQPCDIKKTQEFQKDRKVRASNRTLEGIAGSSPAVGILFFGRFFPDV